ncbi:MAG: hypothetical protein KAJ19_27825, partial [Gammaproteobacteria bacterium]|nr:hypothetical protein [Gammaproteobacteria bacterium]
MDTGTLVLTSAGLDIAGNYTVIDNGDGTYTVVLNTTAFLEPGAYLVNAQMTYGGSRYGNNANAQFTFSVLYRAILATADPVGNTAWLQNIEVTLHLTDGETATLVSNSTGGVRIDLASQNATDPDILSLATTWTPGTNTYDVVISNTLGIGTHIIFLNVSYDYGAPFYGYRVVKLTISIRKHSTELQLYEPAAQTGFGLDTTFQLRYVDLDTGLPIEGASISINNITLNGNWTITPIGGNLYEIRINTSAFLEIGNYWIELETQNSGALANYADTTIYVRVYVRERHTLLAYDPVGTVGYTDNVTITVYYSDSDLGNSGITNVTSALRLITNQTIYYVSNGAQPGSFVIELPANQFVAFEYTALRINMTYFGVPYYQNQTIVIRFQITGTSTEFVWDPSDPVPYGNRANITFYWGDLDSGSPVNCVLGDDTEITVQSVTQPGLNTSNPMILMVVQGQDVGGYATFFLLLNTSYLDDYRTYEFRISLDWTNSSQVPYYEDQLSKLVSIIVRMRDTAVPQVQADPIPYGENATIRLQYVDLDNASLLITGSSLNISVSDGLTYYVNPNPVGGFYEIEIMTHGTGLLGSTQINITIEWYGKPFFENQTTVKVILNINPRIVNIEIDYPASTPYMDNFTFYIYLQDTHSMEYINNNESFISSVFRAPNIAEKPEIHYIGGSNGKYMITFDTTLFGQTGSYILEIAYNHTYSAPYYAIILRNVSGVIRTRATNLDYEPVLAVPYGNYMIFNVTYSDVDESPSVGIDTAQIYLSKSGEQLDLGVDFWY